MGGSSVDFVGYLLCRLLHSLDRRLIIILPVELLKKNFEINVKQNAKFQDKNEKNKQNVPISLNSSMHIYTCTVYKK